MAFTTTKRTEKRKENCLTIIYELITNVIKRAVNTAPEPDAMTCWYGLIVAVAVESFVISEEKHGHTKIQMIIFNF